MFKTKAKRDRRGQQAIRARKMLLTRGKSVWPLLLLALVRVDLVNCLSNNNVNGNDRGRRRNTYSATSRLPSNNYLDENDIVTKDGISQQEQRSNNNDLVSGVNGRRRGPRQRQRERRPLDRNQEVVTLPPHAGYHGGIVSANDPTKPFFEGWYLRVVLPPESIRKNEDAMKYDQETDTKPTSARSDDMSLTSFAIIFHVFDPHSNISKRQGVGMQVVTSMGNVVVESPNVSRFQADSHILDLSNEFYSSSVIKSINERRRRIRQRIRKRQGISKINGDNGSDDESGIAGAGDSGDFFKLTSTHVAGRASSSSWYSFLASSTPSYDKRQNTSNKNSMSKYAKRESSGKGTISSIQFDFDLLPQIGWGGAYDTAERQYSTAGWMAALPVFEPHYQVLISKGIIPSGTITITTKATKTKNTELRQLQQEVNGRTVTETNQEMSSQLEETIAVETASVYDLTNATVYLEKNWGGSFPSKWWWIQANTFVENNKNNNDEEASDNAVVDLCVTSTGARRRIPFLEQEEPVALIGLHWNGQFLPFPNVDWDVRWGQWYVRGHYGEYYVELFGTCDSDVVGLPVRCPTDRGMEDIAMETFHGKLNVKLYKKDRKTLLLDATSNEACLELGGIPWTTQPVWEGKSEMTEPIKLIAMNVNLEKSVSDALQVLSRFVEIPGL